MDLEKLNQYHLEIKQISSISAILGWDQETQMPGGGSEIRASHLGYLSTQIHKIQTGEPYKHELAKWIDLETGLLFDKGLLPDLQRILHLAWRSYKDANVLTEDFVEEMSVHASRCQHIWAESRQKNDFEAFAPHLEKMILLKRQEAEFYGYRTTPYDALLDRFEPGMTEERVSTLFDELKGPLQDLLNRIQKSGTSIDDAPLHGDFPQLKQKVLCENISRLLGFDFDRGRMDISTHPFTTSFHPTDVRITTRFDPRDIRPALYAAIHEAGHGLYEQGLLVDDYGSPLGEAVSYGFHESQSRLWENVIGRGFSFCSFLMPEIQKMFPGQLEAMLPRSFFQMVNIVRPSLIRVEADEVTYPLHIMVRFEIEKMLINEGLPVADIPGMWNELMEKYLGIRPSEAKDGAMQDVHWSMGAFGYFPTYSLGNFYAAAIADNAFDMIPNFEAEIKNGCVKPLLDWLQDKIYSSGRRYDAEDFIEKITGKKLSIQPFMEYLSKKYKDVYDL